MTKFQDMTPLPWETTTQSGRADLRLHQLVRDAYKVACLIEDCGGSPDLTTASSAAFRLSEDLSDYIRAQMCEHEKLVTSNNSNAMEAMMAQAASDRVSDGRLRDLWKAAGGSVDKKKRAFLEIDLLPNALRKIIDAALKADSSPSGEAKS